MTAFPAALLVVPAPEEEILVSSTFSELVYGFGGAGKAVLSFQEATDLLWRPLLLQFLLHRDCEECTQCHFEALLLRSPAGGIRLMLRFCGVICSVHTVPLNLSCDGVHTATQSSAILRTLEPARHNISITNRSSNDR